jgi:hypothetical protein
MATTLATIKSSAAFPCIRGTRLIVRGLTYKYGRHSRGLGRERCGAIQYAHASQRYQPACAKKYDGMHAMSAAKVRSLNKRLFFMLICGQDEVRWAISGTLQRLQAGQSALCV